MSTARPTLPTAVSATTLATAALVLLPAAAASAHVTVAPDSTAAGGYSELVFSVPTESETASTTQLRVELPAGTPFSYVASRPVPGWTATVEEGPLPEPVDVGGATLTEAARAVVWTAEPGAEVAPGEYQQFAITVGPLPEQGTEVVLPATQTYSDGEVVAWAQEAAGSEEPELPAPALTTTAPDDEHGAGAHDEAAAPADEGTTADPAVALAAAETSGGDATARWLGAGGLALGAGALVLALLGRRTAAQRPGAAS